MKIIKRIITKKANVVYDDIEFSLRSNLNESIVAFIGSVFLLTSACFNSYIYFEKKTTLGLYLLIPLLTISLGYLIATSLSLYNALQLKEKWYSYISLKSVTITLEGKSVWIVFNFLNGKNQDVVTSNDRYFWQFVDYLKKKQIEIIRSEE
jgi:hypothetical protein